MINGIRLRCELPWYEEGIESNTLYIILIYIYIYIYIYIMDFIPPVQIYYEQRINMISLCNFMAVATFYLH